MIRRSVVLLALHPHAIVTTKIHIFIFHTNLVVSLCLCWVHYARIWPLGSTGRIRLVTHLGSEIVWRLNLACEPGGVLSQMKVHIYRIYWIYQPSKLYQHGYARTLSSILQQCKTDNTHKTLSWRHGYEQGTLMLVEWVPLADVALHAAGRRNTINLAASWHVLERRSSR